MDKALDYLKNTSKNCLYNLILYDGNSDNLEFEKILDSSEITMQFFDLNAAAIYQKLNQIDSDLLTLEIISEKCEDIREVFKSFCNFDKDMRNFFMKNANEHENNQKAIVGEWERHDKKLKEV